MRHKPKKSLGQNFLIDRNIQERIIQASDLKKDDTVLEIGPGRGELTQELLNKAKKLIAVELDAGLCDRLKEKFSSYPNFELLHQDILETDLSSLLTGAGKIKVIANLPYYISTPAISHLLKHKKYISEIYLTLQKEVAQRICASPGTKAYGAFSCFAQFHAQAEILFEIKSASFWPRPKVDSCFIRLKALNKPKLKIADEEIFFRIIRTAFNQRRKQLKNSLKKILAPEAFKKTGTNPNSRAENLSLADFARLNNFLSQPHQSHTHP